MIKLLKKIGSVSWSFVKYGSFLYCFHKYIVPVNIMMCSGSSMEPTLNSYDLIVTEKYSVRKRNLKW
jgi:signal peptidase I